MRTRFACQDPSKLGRKAYDGVSADTLVKASTAFFELKAEEGDPPGTIRGYGSVFGAVDSYGEATAPGAFKKSLREWKKAKRPIPMLWNHRSDEPIGGWTDFDEDEKGLVLVGQINLEVRRGAETYSLAKGKQIGGLSIGYFELKADPYDYEGLQEGPRMLYELDLREVSPVTFPALREAQLDPVKAKRARGELLSVREFESALREKLGWSRAFAEDVTSLGYKQVLLREQGPGAIPERAIAEEVRSLRSTFTPLNLPPL